MALEEICSRLSLWTVFFCRQSYLLPLFIIFLFYFYHIVMVQIAQILIKTRLKLKQKNRKINSFRSLNNMGMNLYLYDFIDCKI